MPELPEVETIARGVNERLRGDRIVEVWFGSHSQPFKTPPVVSSTPHALWASVRLLGLSGQAKGYGTVLAKS